jgi:hypothetical protein
MFLPEIVKLDDQAWNIYQSTPHRWVFNKLEVALRQGLHAGPAAVAPQHDGWYVSRPIYNLYGMGVGAERFHYDASMETLLNNHAVVPPGHFWCEWLPGDHLSTDYRKTVDGDWVAVSVWRGVHYSDENLTKFKHWERLPGSDAPPIPDMFDFLDDVPAFNFESRDGKVVEVHLRLGDMPDVPVGARLVPIWEEDGLVEPDVMDPDPEMFEFRVSGHIKSLRKGFLIK